MNQDITTYNHLFTKDLKDAFNNINGNSVKRIYAVMSFNTEFELGISNKPYEWVNSYAFVTLDGAEALHKYIHSTIPMTEIIDADSFEELNKKMIKMTNNFKKPEYVNAKIESRFY
jgi:hypothetical protein